MKIDLQVAPNQVTLIFENTSSQDIRLWELKNSWGWFAPRFEIQAADGKKAATRISHTENMVWTRDVPSYFIVPAKGTYKLVIPLNDGQWDVSGELPSSSQKARVRAIYHVDTTPESEEYHVFTGTIESNWVQLEPPYTWLPTVSKKK